MKAIKIDAENRKVEEIKMMGLKDALKVFGSSNKIEYQFLTTRDIIIIDVEGLVEDPKYYFVLENETQLLAGNGFIMGIGKRGESIDPEITLEYVQENILWMDDMTAGLYSALMKIANS